MSRYELTVDSNYVKDWGIPQAIRELFQNAYDAEQEDSTNKAFCDYNPETEVLEIGNEKSILNIESLLLGATSKANDDNTVGQFGEGYKLATLVLLRNNKQVTFYNYGNKEVWNTKLVKSRRYNGRLVPVFTIDKKFVWQKVPHHNLIIEIKGITEDEYETIRCYIMPLNGNIDKVKCITSYDSYYGDIILDDDYSGKIFVNGLYVCHNKDLKYGYNIAPKYIKLERDRQTVSSFDLYWHTTRMWTTQTKTPEIKDLFMDLLFAKNDSNYADIRYFANITEGTNAVDVDWFFEHFGYDAIPVNSQEEFDFVKANGGNPVIVTGLIRNVFADVYDKFAHNTKDTTTISCHDRLVKWFENLCDEVDVPDHYYTEFNMILDLYEDELS